MGCLSFPTGDSRSVWNRDAQMFARAGLLRVKGREVEKGQKGEIRDKVEYRGLF
jgi:hypothetical protein